MAIRVALGVSYMCQTCIKINNCPTCVTVKFEPCLNGGAMCVCSLQISNLLAKVMTSAPRPKPVLAAANIGYQVQWQAMSCADYPADYTAASARQIRQHRQSVAVWKLTNKENSAPVVRRSWRGSCTAVSPIEELQRAGLSAQHHLRNLQARTAPRLVNLPLSVLCPADSDFLERPLLCQCSWLK